MGCIHCDCWIDGYECCDCGLTPEDTIDNQDYRDDNDDWNDESDDDNTSW